jgi:hypothetical protein
VISKFFIQNFIANKADIVIQKWSLAYRPTCPFTANDVKYAFIFYPQTLKSQPWFPCFQIETVIACSHSLSGGMRALLHAL